MAMAPSLFPRNPNTIEAIYLTKSSFVIVRTSIILTELVYVNTPESKEIATKIQ